MLIDESGVRELLRRVVHSVAHEAELQDDLMQEALINLWQQELQRPGQTRSWYLQNCRFHLRNHLGQGRSIDSIKHRTRRCATADLGENNGARGADLPGVESPRASVSAREIFGLLSRRLRPAERAVLRFLAGGHSVRDIARKLKVSHQAVSKHRQAIASLAVQLGISPFPKRSEARRK
jgi:DNA-directed RNA polymerase specialized sigma24 family protein